MRVLACFIGWGTLCWTFGLLLSVPTDSRETAPRCECLLGENSPRAREAAVSPFADSAMTGGGAEAQSADLRAFRKAAVARALAKQQRSSFLFTPNEAMTYGDLRKKLSDPIEKRRTDFRAWLDKNPSLDTRKLWDEFVRQEDAALYQKFRANLASGEHCEAHIYYGWITTKPVATLAIREAYRAYIRSYEKALEEFRTAEKEQIALHWSCKSLDGNSIHKLRLVSEGVRPQSLEHARQLYAEKESTTVWPYFPTVALTFRLSDGTDGAWQNFVLYDIRHYDRTASDRVRQGLEWMIGGWGGSYDETLKTKGVAAALAVFDANLEITTETGAIHFKDRETKVGFDLIRTKGGMVYITKRSHFLLRCTPIPQKK